MRFVMMAILAMFMSSSYANVILHGKIVNNPKSSMVKYRMVDSSVMDNDDYTKKNSDFPANEYSIAPMSAADISYDVATPENERIIALGHLNQATFTFESNMKLRKSTNNYFSFELFSFYKGTFSTLGGDGFVDYKIVKIKIDDKDSLVLDGSYKNTDGKLVVSLNDKRFKLEPTEDKELLDLVFENNVPVTIELQRIK